MSSLSILFACICVSTLLLSASGSDNANWSMKPVRTIQARVQGDKPVWKNNRFESSFGPDAAMDTVNTASVEGALMYVQAECINAKVQTSKCKRKNNVKYVVFYDITIVQPTDAIAFHQDENVKPEYGHFVAMDSGACTKVGDKIPVECQRFHGLNDQVKLGPYIGGSDKSTDPRALYSNTIWFSFPNTCPTIKWGKNTKTPKCQKEQPGGLCPLGVAPDGRKCTYQYDILGYVELDDLVGITTMTNSATKGKFKDFAEFCQAGLVEFEADDTFTTVKSDLTFWNNPKSRQANDQRTKAMIEHYAQVAKKSTQMKPMPQITDLTKNNPKCYENVKQCATSKFGCKRLLYAQICAVCEKKGEAGCEIAPKSFSFPKLVKPKKKKNKGTDDTNSSSQILGVSFALAFISFFCFLTQ